MPEIESSQIYKLEVLNHLGVTESVCGKRTVLNAAMNAWIGIKTSMSKTEREIITIAGYLDTADRAECILAIPVENVCQMTLIRLY